MSTQRSPDDADVDEEALEWVQTEWDDEELDDYVPHVSERMWADLDNEGESVYFYDRNASVPSNTAIVAPESRMPYIRP